MKKLTILIWLLVLLTSCDIWEYKDNKFLIEEETIFNKETRWNYLLINWNRIKKEDWLEVWKYVKYCLIK